jgi:hypothetical protein
LRTDLRTLEDALVTARCEASWARHEILARLVRLGVAADDLPTPGPGLGQDLGMAGMSRMYVDAQLRQEHLPRHRADLEAAIGVLEVWIKTLPEEDGTVWEVPEKLLASWTLEFMLRGSDRGGDPSRFHRALWNEVRADLVGLRGLLPVEPPNSQANHADTRLDELASALEREVSALAARGETDLVLDRLEVLFALPDRVESATRLRRQAASLFPEASVTGPLDQRVRSRRYQALIDPRRPSSVPPPLNPPRRAPQLLGDPVLTLTEPSRVEGLALSPDGATLVVNRQGGSHRVYRVPTGILAGEFDAVAGHRLDGNGPEIVESFAPDGSRFLTAAHQTARVRNTGDWSVLSDLQPVRQGQVLGIAMTPDGHHLLVLQGTTLRLHTPWGAFLGDIPLTATPPAQLAAMTPDGRLAAVRGDGLELVNLDARRPDQVLWAYWGDTRVLAVEPRSFRYAIVADSSQDAWIVPLRTGDETRSLGTSVNWAAFSTDGRLLAHPWQADQPAALENHRIVLRQVPTWSPVAQVAVPGPSSVREARFSPEGHHLILIEDHALIVVDLPEAQVRSRSFPAHQRVVRHALSADGRFVALTFQHQPETVQVGRLIER